MCCLAFAMNSLKPCVLDESQVYHNSLHFNGNNWPLWLFMGGAMLGMYFYSYYNGIGWIGKAVSEFVRLCGGVLRVVVLMFREMSS